jgi:hypothetical protein
MRKKVVMGLFCFLLVLICGNLALGWGGKIQPPSAEIISAVQTALSPRLLASESDEDGPDEEDTIFVLMYAFSPAIEKCELCERDLKDMFGIVLFNSELVKQGKVSVWLTTEVDSKTASIYLTNILAPLFSAKKIEPAQVESYIKAIHFMSECESDFAEEDGMQLPIIGIVDTTKEDEDNGGNLYISAGAPGPWSKFDQLILAKSSP